MNRKWIAALSVGAGAVLSLGAQVYAADAPGATDAPPCGKLVGPSASGNGNAADAGFTLRNGEAVDFVAGGRTTHGKLLVYTEGQMFRAYWQPQGGEEKYALANAGPNSVRLISTTPQGTPTTDGKPGITTQPMQVLSCPQL